jgi:hypothetical protein
VFGPSTRSLCLLCPLLTSATSSRRLSATLALGKVTDLPGYCALTFTLMPAAYMCSLSVQVSGFGHLCVLTQTAHLLCDSCSSGQRFAYSFLRISPRGEHPCCSANDSPCRARSGLSPVSKCALPGAHNEGRPRGAAPTSFGPLNNVNLSGGLGRPFGQESLIRWEIPRHRRRKA